MTYSEKLKSPRWQRKRLEILNRDNFTCQDCGETKETLHVHHCGYMKGDPWETPSVLLRCLCWKCHEARQAAEDAIRLKLALLFSRMTLDELVEAMKEAGKMETCDFSGSLLIADAYRVMHETDMRWFNQACDHPEMRPIYDHVMGVTTNWAKLDDARKKQQEEDGF